MNLSTELIENLSIHGVGHILTKKRNRCSRSFWMLTFVASICGLVYYSTNLYIKLNISPDISIRINEKFTNKVPFSAITICTPLFAKNQLANFYNFSRDLKTKGGSKLNLTLIEQNYLASNVHTCNPSYGKTISKYTQNRTEKDVVKLLNNSFLSVTEALIQCGYKNFINNCTKLFNRVLTDRGYCYSFNLQGFNTIFNANAISVDFQCFRRSKIAKSMYVSNKLTNETINDGNEMLKWTLDNGYIKNHETDSVPVKAQKGTIVSANVYLKESDALNICSQVGNIFSFYIHLPNEIMMTNWHQEQHVEFGRKKDVILTAKSYKADEGMRSFSPKSRGCYFEGEKRLKFFKTYTKALCEFECMTNYTLKVCGCVKFSMPRASNTPVCSIEDAECYFEAISLWPDYEAAENKFEVTCGCLRTCSDIKYGIKIEKTSALDNVNSVFDVYNISRRDAVSRITFMFDEFEILEYEEYASYKLQNFIADVGGLLGFFLGCSILSIIEIFYFMTEAFTKRFKIKDNNSVKLGGNDLRQSQSNEKFSNDKEFLESLHKISEKIYINPTRLYVKSDDNCLIIPME